MAQITLANSTSANENYQKESSQNRIQLDDDPQFAVSCMVQYCYHFSYKPEPGTYIEPTPSISAVQALTLADEATSPLPSLIQAHATIYTLAEKYDIPGLKPLAKANFTSTASNSLRWKSHHGPQAAQMQAFYDVIPYIYTNTAPNEMGLRSSVVEVWGTARRFVHDAADRKTWHGLVDKFPELGTDMITGLVHVDGLDDEEYDRESYCGGFADDDDGKGDFTANGGWGREENDDLRDDGAGNGWLADRRRPWRRVPA